MSTAIAYRQSSTHVPAWHESRRKDRRLSCIEALILVATIAVVLLAATLPSVGGSIGTPTRTQTVAVRTSQSLWDIAREYPQADKSTAQTVQVIRRLNRLEQSALTPGQLLQVPAETPVIAADARR